MNKDGMMDSGLSFGERIIYTSYDVERKLGVEGIKTPSFYQKKLQTIKKKLERQIAGGETAEDVICGYMKKLNYKHPTPPTESLREGSENCVSATALFFAFAEMLDWKLYVNINPINASSKEGGHVFVRKLTSKGNVNFDQGNMHEDSYYTKNYENLHEVPKRNLITYIKENAAWDVREKGEDLLEYDGEPFLAKECFDKGLSIMPNHHDCLLWTGRFYEEIKDYKKAREVYENGLKIYPDSPDFLSHEGNVLTEFKEYEEALNCCNKALKICPDHTLAAEVLNCCLDYVGQKPEITPSSP